MRTVALCFIIFALCLLTAPQVSAANMPGESCTEFGTTILSDDHVNIVACLCPEGTSVSDGSCHKTGATNTVWKAMSHSLRDGILPFQTFSLNSSNNFTALWYNNTQRNAEAVLTVCAGGSATRDTTLVMKTGGYPTNFFDGYNSLFSGEGRGSAFLIVPPGYYLRGDMGDPNSASNTWCVGTMYVWLL